MSKLSIYPTTLDGSCVEQKRQEIKDYFHNTYELYEKVFEVLKDDEVFYKKSEITRHPMIFYFGHTATFFINKLINMKVIDKRINPNFESIFAVGVDEMTWDDVDSKNYNWPKIDDVREYRALVKNKVDELIMTLPLNLPITQDSGMWIILMGIEHERIHIETSLVLHRQMPIEFIKEVPEFNICEEVGEAPKNKMITIPTCQVHLGKEKSHNLYGWDNEYGDFSEDVKEFQASKYLVSNGEFMEFVKDGGYEKDEFWDDEGKKFLQLTSAKYPSFWVKDGEEFKYRTLSSIIHMPQNWPVDVNALEAEAFCRYKSKKDGVCYALPSEAEYGAITRHVGLEEILDFDENKANQNLVNFSSSPVNKYGFDGIYDVIGNVWQWSKTPIRGFSGFKVHPAYDDFSTPTFDEKHALILGSSWASSGNLIMKNSRYAFRKHFYQHAGFRYVISSAKDKEVEDIYESDELVSQYCEFQYGDENFGIKNFAVETAKIASKFATNKTKALDLGCATGRASFELAKEFDEVEGIDFSVRFIGVGSKLKSDGYVAFHSVTEGELVTNKKVTIQELGYEKLKEKVSFWQGDACNLKQSFNSYDLILISNIEIFNNTVCNFFESLSRLLNKEGVVVTVNNSKNLQNKFFSNGYKIVTSKNLNTTQNDENITLFAWAKYE